MKILRLLLPLLLVVLAGCAARNQTADQRQAYVAEDTSRTVDLTHPPRDMWDRIRRGFAIPNLRNERVDYWTDYYASHPQSVLLMSQRAGKYLYYIVDELNRRGLPTELALLPFVESAYNPNALSRSKASGLWQFIPSTGLYYKLEQNGWRDQRRDPVASTQAALDYLSYLYDFQGDWYLALASYNWGEGAVKRAMDKAADAGKPTGYTALDMPDETRNYVPKLQAIKNIIARPEKFGITLPGVSNTPYFTTVHKSRDMDIAVAAALAEMPLEDFQALNPSYNRPVILASHSPALHLPLDKVGVFNENLEVLHRQPVVLADRPPEKWSVPGRHRQGARHYPGPTAPGQQAECQADPRDRCHAAGPDPRHPSGRPHAGFLPDDHQAGRPGRNRNTGIRPAKCSGPAAQAQRPHPYDPPGRHAVCAGAALQHLGGRPAQTQQSEGLFPVHRPAPARPRNRDTGMSQDTVQSPADCTVPGESERHAGCEAGT